MKKGCEDLICESYYKELDSKNKYKYYPGKFCYAPIFYTSNNHKVLEPVNIDPINSEKSTFKIINYADNLRSHPPIKELDLKSDEFYFLAKGKYRMVVIIGSIFLSEKNPFTSYNKEEDIYICLPVFTVKEHHSQKFIIDIQAFQYPNLFYLPPAVHYKEESFIRFELIQPVNKGCLRPCGNQFEISDEAYIYLTNHLGVFLNYKYIDKDICGLINIYSTELLERYSNN